MTETRSTELNEQLKQAEKQKVPKRQTPFSHPLKHLTKFRFQ